jgi:uncharacterized RDD family membrane protein YckC
MSQITIVTAQNVTLKIELANIGDRFLAAIIDFLIKLGVTFLLMILSKFILSDVDWFYGLMVLILWVFYSLVFESFMRGQTPGKRLMKIRVARLDGDQLTFGAVFLRWIFKMIDFPFFAWPAIGICAIVVTEKHQRLGDMVAGTILVSTKTRTDFEDTFYTAIGPDYLPSFPQAERLTSREAEVIKHVLHLYHENDQYDMVAMAAEQLKKVLEVHPNMDDLSFLKTVLKDYNYAGSEYKAAEQKSSESDYSRFMPGL